MTVSIFTGRSARQRRAPAAWLVACAAGVASFSATIGDARATPIRTDAANRVPACVTPDRLMAFLATRNDRLDPRFRGIARHYKQHGEAWGVRWDYAFFQMAIETNFLSYRRPDGRWGDVNPRQNNFAGLGTTGGGVPGDSYPDISTGVLAQIQHLVAYSGQRLDNPVGPRTRLKQDDIVAASARLGRPVRFADLARRWAVDPRYGHSIEWVADRYREMYCNGRAAIEPVQVPQAGTPKSAPLPGRLALGGTAPVLSAPPRPARHPAATARAPSPVTTVWKQTKPGEVPRLPPQAGAPRQRAEVAAEMAVAPASKLMQTVPQPASAPSESHDAAAETRAEEPPGPAPAAEVAGPSIALAAAAIPFIGGQIVSQTTGADGACRIVMAASQGESGAALIHTVSPGATELVILPVIEGLEQAMVQNFVRTRAPGGQPGGLYANRDLALARAREICPAAT